MYKLRPKHKVLQDTEAVVGYGVQADYPSYISISSSSNSISLGGPSFSVQLGWD